MALTLEKALAPISDEAPAGPDLSYDHERAQIEQVFEGLSEAGEGEGGPDWRAVLRLIENQFSQTKDIWLAVYACRVGARSGSLETVELGAQILAGLFEQYWDTVHPQLEELGLPGRKAPCDSLAARGDFLMPMERVILLAHPRLGTYSGQDIERFRADAEKAEGYGLFRAAVEEMGEGALREAVGRLSNIEEALRRADKIFTDAAAGEVSPNFAPSYALLGRLKQAASAFIKEPPTTDESEDVPAAGEDAGGGPTPAAQRRSSGRVENRDDVVRSLDMISDYYRRVEPGHPMLQLLDRARHWVTMDFFDLMNDIAPEGVEQARRLLIKRE
jgi:type VI secretion system ImpA family protein